LTGTQEFDRLGKTRNPVMLPQKKDLPPKDFRRHAHSVRAVRDQVMGKDKHWISTAHAATPIAPYDTWGKKQQRIKTQFPGRPTTLSLGFRLRGVALNAFPLCNGGCENFIGPL